MHAVDAHLGGDMRGGARVVAGQHDGMDAHAAQRGDGRLGVLLEAVGHRHHANQLLATGDVERGLALVLQGFQLAGQGRGIHPAVLHPAGVADPDQLAIHLALHAQAVERLELAQRTQGQIQFLEAFGHGLGDRVLGAVFHAGGQA